MNHTLSRHQCFIYEGSPAQHLPKLVALVKQSLKDGKRCLYLNSPSMVAGMRSYLAAAGIDVAQATEKGSLILTSDQSQIVDGHFDTDRMLDLLDKAVQQAIRDGYNGLFATGDMLWQFGGEKGMEKLLDYEWRLEEYFQHQPFLSGICQYHIDVLPADAVRHGLFTHKAAFISDTLSRLNPNFLAKESYKGKIPPTPDLQRMIEFLSVKQQEG